MFGGIMEPHKYDSRGANDEGQFTENLFKEVCRLFKQNFHVGSLKEDCAGVDGYLDGKKLDIKSRKFRQPINTAWMEIAKAGGPIGSGWSYHDKLIAQSMVFAEENQIVKAQFGIYQAKDAVELIENKVNFNSKASKGVLHELYTRWHNGEHRGTMTVLSYADLESLSSFRILEIPRNLWEKVRAFYGYKGIK